MSQEKEWPRHPDECPECGSRLDQTGFHGDGCSQNGPFKPWPLAEIHATSEEKLKRKIVDRLIKRVWRTRWTFGGGTGLCFMSHFKADGQLFGATVWQDFDRWEGNEQVFKYRIAICDQRDASHYLIRQSVCAGPLVFETGYRAGELFEKLYRSFAAKIAKMLVPPPPKEYSLLENLKRILSGI